MNNLILFLLLPLLAIQNYSYYNRKIEKMILLLLIIFSALRGVGTDYKIVRPLFSYYYTISPYIFDRVVGKILLKLPINIELKYQIYISIISILTIILFNKSLKKLLNFKSTTLCILLYILSYNYFLSYNIFRQFLSIMVILYSLRYLLDKKNLKYVLGVIIATTIHNSSIIFILLILFVRFKINYKFYFIGIFILVILGELDIYKNLFSIIPQYGKYSQTIKYSLKRENMRYIRIFYEIMIFLILLLPIKLKTLKENGDYFFVNILILTNFMFIISNYFFIANRILIVFNVFSLISYSYFYDKILKNKKIWQYILILYYCFIYIKMFLGNSGEIHPYMYFWQLN